MNYKKIKKFFAILLIVALVFSFLIINYYQNKCDTMDSIDMSIDVYKPSGRHLLGFNISKDLNFGTTSPGMTSGKGLKVNYSKSADVKIWVNGDFSPWVEIEPAEFEIEPDVIQNIKLTMSIPEDAKDGLRRGKVVVCYNDK